MWLNDAFVIQKNSTVVEKFLAEIWQIGEIQINHYLVKI